jgi:hypothetical protein
MRGHVYRFVEAGFTLISLDASSLPPERAADVYRELAQTALERELALEVAAPLEAGRTSPELANSLLEALEARGVQAQFLRLGGSAYQLEPNPSEVWQLDLKVLEDLVAVAAGHGAMLALEDQSPAPERLAGAFRSAGARKVEPWEAVARAARPVPSSAVDSALRVEALTYSLASELLAAFGAQGSASAAIAALAKGGRY